MSEQAKQTREEQRRRAFDAGLYATGQEYAADLHQVLADAAKRNLDITMEALAYADAYRAGEEDRLRLAVLDSYRETQFALSEFTRDLLGGGEGGEPPASARPFSRPSTDSTGSGTPSGSCLPGQAPTTGLSGSPPQLPVQPVKRGRGRPRKQSLPTPSTSGPGSPGGPSSGS